MKRAAPIVLILSSNKNKCSLYINGEDQRLHHFLFLIRRILLREIDFFPYGYKTVSLYF